MKNVFSILLAILFVLLTATGCEQPNGPDPDPSPSPSPSPSTDPDVSNALPLDFEGSLSADFSIYAGYQNTATLAALSLDTTNNGEINAGGRNYLMAGGGSATWPDAVNLGTQTLKFILRTEGTVNDNSHVVLSFKNLDLTGLGSSTGLEFSIMLPDGPNSIGLSPTIRYNDGSNENASVYSAPLNDPTAENFTDSGTVYDWVYFGDHVFLHFKVPFDCFSIPGWADQSPPATIAGALAEGVVFNQIDFDFRFATTDANGGALDTDYQGFIDNVALY